jgi:hypothetical protein
VAVIVVVVEWSGRSHSRRGADAAVVIAVVVAIVVRAVAAIIAACRRAGRGRRPTCVLSLLLSGNGAKAQTYAGVVAHIVRPSQVQTRTKMSLLPLFDNTADASEVMGMGCSGGTRAHMEHMQAQVDVVVVASPSMMAKSGSRVPRVPMPQSSAKGLRIKWEGGNIVVI